MKEQVIEGEKGFLYGSSSTARSIRELFNYEESAYGEGAGDEPVGAVEDNIAYTLDSFDVAAFISFCTGY